MIREIYNSNELPNVSPSYNTEVALGCDNCKGKFLFTAIEILPNDEYSGSPMQPVTSRYYQMFMVKFCPFCGARNTEPTPTQTKS